MSSLAISGGAFDLSDNDLIVDAAQLPAIAGLIRSGYATGNWNGPGINSSSARSIALNVGRADWETYRTSKAALNMGVRSFHNRHAHHPVLSIAPGWVRTDMGGPHATLSVEQSVRGIVDVLESRAGSGRHGFVDYRDRDVAW